MKIKVAKRYAERMKAEGAKTRTNENGKKEIYVPVSRFSTVCAWFEIEE